MSDLPAAERCSTRSLERAEPVLGTASTVRRWLLLEQPGPWDRTALATRRLPTGLGAELARRANRDRIRIVLIRRHGRSVTDASPACFVARTRPTGSWLGRVSLEAAVDVLDLDLAAVVDGRSPGAETVDGTVFCVCTHGRHDPCCAERGRPVAAALSAELPEQTWEVSHIGGDRFAGNVVCLPDGDYLGRVTAAGAAGIARSYLDGDYVLDTLRGRSCYPPSVQAADVLVRQRLGVTRRDAVRISGVHREGSLATVGMSVAGHGDLVATVRAGAPGPPHTLTCTATTATAPPTYELVNLTGGS